MDQRRVRVIGAERLLQNCQRAPEQRLGPRVLALLLIQRPQLPQDGADIGRIGAEALLAYRQ